MNIVQEHQVSDEGRPGRSRIGMVGRLLTWTIAIALAVIALFWLSRIGAIAFSFFTINEQIGEVRALPGGTVAMLSLILSVLFVTLGSAALYYLVTGFRVGQALFALASLAVLQFGINAAIDHFAQPRQLSLESMTSQAFFDRKGNSLIWYATGRAESCPDIFDAPGFHPITREKLMPVTSEIAQKIQACLVSLKKTKQQRELLAARKDKGATPVMITSPIESVTFFDPATGEPLIWASKNNECFDLFRNGEGGYHPVTRNPLVPVDARLANQILSCRKKEEKQRLMAEEEKRAEERAVAELARQEAQQAAAETAKQETARQAAIVAARQETAAASVRSMPTEAAPANFKIVNYDCMPQDFYLNGTFIGRASPNGGMIEALVAPGSYTGRVCLSHDHSKCSGPRNEVLASGNNITRRVERNRNCPVVQL